MKKIILAFAVAVAFVGCVNPVETNEENSILGNWLLVMPPTDSVVYTFLPGGDFVSTTDSGTYSIADSVLTIKYDFHQFKYVYSFTTRDSMRWKYKNYDSTVYLTRVQ